MKYSWHADQDQVIVHVNNVMEDAKRDISKVWGWMRKLTNRLFGQSDLKRRMISRVVRQTGQNVNKPSLGKSSRLERELWLYETFDKFIENV